MIQPLKKILAIDDDENILTIIKYSLELQKNTTILCALSGDDGLKKALEFNPDLILLDVLMPSMDGFTTFRALRKIKELTHCPIIFITARIQDSEIQKYLAQGVAGVIIKPFEPLTLFSDVQNIYIKHNSH